MKRYITLLMLVALVVLSLVPALSAQDSLIESLCLVTDVGRVNDGTFNEFAYNGMLRAADDFGLEATAIETTAQTEYEGNIQTCIDSGFDVVITVGFLIQDATLAAAEANPDVYFIGIDQGFEMAPANLVGVLFREDQAGFLAGAMAAQMSESGTVAGVYGIPVPAVVKFRNGYEQGARYINPDIVTQGIYIDNFVAPDRGATAAQDLIGEGADVIFGAGGSTGSGAIQEGARQGVYVIGVDQDEYFTTFGGGETPGAEFLITSAMKRVDQGVYVPIEGLVGGSDASFGGNQVLSALNDGISFAPSHDSDVPEEVTAQVQAIFEGLKAGTIVTGVDPVSGELLPNIAEVASSTEGFSTLVAAADAAGLVDTLANGGPFTVFAPTDEAFAAALEALGLTAEELLADTETLTSILLYHVVEGAVPAEVVVTLDGAAVPTVNGADVTISVSDMGVMVNDVNVVATDVYAANGIIHVIDGVLLPPAAE
jgi:basic membrane lipoprotein Med (substrate-binding protein (PBP1-ABC) superfamily)